MQRARRVSSLDGLRGVAAILVMAFHFNIFFLPQARLSAVVPFLGRAYLAVDLFFLLSGFVMAHVYGCLLASNWRAHWRQFALARFARLYPLFAITTLAVVALVALCHAPTKEVLFSGRSLALQPIMLQQWCSGLSWNYPSWSISTEAEAYLFFLFSAGFLVSGKCPRLMAASCFLVLTILCIIQGGSINYFVGFAALIRTLAGFSLGVIIYRFHLSRTDFTGKRAGVLAGVLLGLAAVTRIDSIAICGFAFIIYGCANATNLFARFLETRPLVAIGNWSYSIYLWHAPMSFAVIAALAAAHYPVSKLDMPHARLLLLTTASAVVGVAAVHYRLVETPIRQLLRRSKPSLGP